MNETMLQNNDKSGSDEWKDFDFSTVNVEKPRVTRVLPKREVLWFVIIGLIAGAAVWLVRLAVEAWIISPLFCRTPDTASICASAGHTSFVTALIIIGLIVSSILTASRVFRSVLISAATFVSLAALWPILHNRSAVAAVIISAMFCALLYLFFSMIAAVKRYLLAIVLLVAFVVAFWVIIAI